jgi:hypothetical protein
MNVNGHCSDLGFVSIPHLDIEHDGYIPYDLNIGGGDDVEFSVCLDCGKIQRDFPIKDEQIFASLSDV